MNNSNNWLKLNRNILESSVFDNPKLLKVWIWCLCKASHKEHDQVVGRQIQHLDAGQFIYGRNKAAEELRMKPSTVRDYISALKLNGNIDIKSNNKYSVITVVNWAIYQNAPTRNRQQTDNKRDNKRTTNGQQTDTNKNVYKGKNVKNNNIDNYSYLKLREEIKKRSEQALKEISENESNN